MDPLLLSPWLVVLFLLLLGSFELDDCHMGWEARAQVTRNLRKEHEAILYYTRLYYTILYYTILYYTILYYTILYYTILYYTILHYTLLYSTLLYYTLLYTLSIFHILYTIYYIPVYYILYTIYCILYTIYYILCTIYYILYTILYYAIHNLRFGALGNELLDALYRGTHPHSSFCIWLEQQPSRATQVLGATMLSMSKLEDYIIYIDSHSL